MFAELFAQVLRDYARLRESGSRDKKFEGVVSAEIPSVVREYLLGRPYKVKGSVGQGNLAEIPWVAVMHNDVTTSTQDGYYVCFLIDSPKEALYLSLMAGWTAFNNEFGGVEARAKISEYCDYMARKLNKNIAPFRRGTVDFSGTNPLSRGYGLGQILHKKYTIDDLRDSSLFNDLDKCIAYYERLIGLVGSDLLNIDYDDIRKSRTIRRDEQEINQVTLTKDTGVALSQLESILQNSVPSRRSVLVSKIIRNRKLADFVKASNNYICELCDRPPFEQKNGKPYAEADHVVPLGGEHFGPDTFDNLRCLCAQCHAVVTYGSDEELEKLLQRISA